MFKKKGKKGQVTIIFIFLLVAVILIVMSAILIPMGILFTTEMYTAGERILKLANTSIQNIENDTVRESITGALDQAFAAQENNIVVLTDMFQYSWIVILVLVFIVIFMFTRRLVAVGAGGGGFV